MFGETRDRIDFKNRKCAACMNTSVIIPPMKSTVADNAEDSAAADMFMSLEPKNSCFTCVTVITHHPFLIAIARRSSAICLIFI